MTFPPKIFHRLQRVSLEKLAAAPNPVTSPGTWDEWDMGSSENNGSLPIDYTLHGFLLTPIHIGEAIKMLRTHRNGVERLGYFRSTPVVQFRGENLVETFNSIYRITESVISDTEVQ
jgi:hypothetical protein